MPKISRSMLTGFITAFLVLPAPMLAAHMTSHDIGVNVPGIQYGYDNMDDMRSFLDDTDTRFVRETFDLQLYTGSSSGSWFNRADLVMDEYESRDIETMGILTNTKDPQINDLDAWRTDVRSVATHFKGEMRYWQIGMIPEQIGSAEHYGEVLSIASEEIKAVDSDVQVVTGGLSYASASVQPNSTSDYIDRLLAQYRYDADIWGFSVYSCDFYTQGKHWAMTNGVTRTTALIKRANPDAKFMVTELGCAVDGGTYTEAVQASYLQDSVSYFTAHGDFERIILHNSIDQGTDTVGLTTNFTDYRKAGEWYRDEIPATPYDKAERPLDELTAEALQLRADLESTYFGAGTIPVAAGNWNKLVFADSYGGYSVEDIAFAIRHGGVTVHPTIPHSVWQHTDTYKNGKANNPF